MIHIYHMNPSLTKEQMQELYFQAKVAEKNNDVETLDMLDLTYEKIDLGKILGSV